MSYGQHSGYGQPSGYGHPGGYTQRGYDGPRHEEYGPRHGWRRSEYSDLLYSEEFADAVMRVCAEKMDEVLASQGYFPAGMQGAGYGAHGYDHEKHMRFKEVLEELRDLPTAEAQRRMGVMFPGLDEEGKRVLSVLVSETSKKKLAQKANMTLEKFMQVKHELEEKLK